MAEQSPLLVFAIDFGTTYSGGAFSFRHEFEKDPTKVCAQNWQGGQLVSLKGPTCALIRPDGKTLEAFGYTAETQYGELASDEEHQSWYFFKRFKMKLWNQSIGRLTQLEDEGGKKLSAKTVFSLSIKFLKDELLEMGSKQIGAAFKSDEIAWVLTVPAIWSDTAKQFMREAAEEAGISGDRLSIALEPEAASLFCRHLSVAKTGASSLSKFTAGKRYLVLDAGGGTVDITVHEVTAGGYTKELHQATGGAWGGTEVDKEFMDFLTKLAGSSVTTKFKENHMEDYINLLRDFEIKKRAIGPKANGKVTIQFPLAFAEVVKEEKGEPFAAVIKKSVYSDRVSHKGDKLRLDADIMKGFFQTSVKSVLDHVSSLLKESECIGVDSILMVGGYSESPMLQEELRTKFSHLKLIVPDDAGLAVLKGAVIFGHTPTAIKERISRRTYGVSVRIPFDSSKHPLSTRIQESDGTYLCNESFSKHIEVGQSLTIGEAQSQKKYTVPEENSTYLKIIVFATVAKDPLLTIDPGCTKVGRINVPVSGHGKGRSVMVKMIFGGTEIRVECTEEATKNVSHLKIDFLT